MSPLTKYRWSARKTATSGSIPTALAAAIARQGELESYADTVAAAATILARHADRRTIKSEDVKTYYKLEPYFE